MEQIRILHFVGKMHRGGIETLLMCIYRKLDRDKIQFDFLLTTEEPGYYDEEIKKLGGRLYYISSRREHYFKSRKELYAILCDHPEIKAVQLHMSSCSYIDPLIVAKKAGVPCRIAHAHNIKCAGKLRNLVHRINRKKIKRYATLYLACSNDAGNWMFLPEKWKKGILIKNGIESKKYIFNMQKRKNIRTILKINKDEFVIGYVGRFTEQKNPMFICEVFKEVKQKRNNVKLLLVGDGNMHNQMDEFFEREFLKDDVIYTGIVENVEDYMQAMDCLVLPSLFEGLGIVAIEAQASGLPTLLSDKVPKEAVITKLAKILTIDNGIECWVEYIINTPIIKRKNMQQEIINAGYDIEMTAKRLSEIYLNI